MKYNFKKIPRNQESSNLDLIRVEIEDWSGEKIWTKKSRFYLKFNQIEP